MLIPLSWLRDFVDVHVTVDELAEIITNAGLEVTGVEHIGTEGAALPWDRDKVLLARVLRVEQHPDADRLVLATVDFGADEPKQVVTGAPNLLPFVGEGDLGDRDLMSPLLLEGGTYLDPTKDGRPTRLKGKKLRGIHNDAMLCSPVELGLGEDHDGILLAPGRDFRPDGTSPAPGTPLVDVLGDAVLEIDIIPNIARCASVLGVAREVAALTRQTLRPPSFEVTADGPPVDGEVVIETTEPELNPRFVALLVEGVEQKPAPLWMQHRLRLAGQRPIDAVVDVSNYVMLEIGQPNHTFDWDFLRRRADAEAGSDQPVRLVTRLAEPGEKVTTLDDVEREIPASTILVTDPTGPLSIGGIMGGAESEIGDATSNVLLEAAAWNFINIRHSARLLGLNTEASFRFSRGVHPSQALLGARRAAELLRLHAGGTVRQGIVDHVALETPQVTIDLDVGMVNRRSGLSLDADAVADHLRRLEFGVEPGAGEGTLRVTVPDHRLDVEAPHDLLEEVCRMEGYANIPETVLADPLPPQRGNPTQEMEDRIRDLLAAAGFQEVITYRLTTPEAEARLRVDATEDERPWVRLANPSTRERAVMRHSVLASVMEIVGQNLRHRDRALLFELGHVYLLDGGSPWGDDLPSERPRLALAMTGPRSPEQWDRGVGDSLDFFDLKGDLEDLLASLHVAAAARFEPAEDTSFRPGRTARLLVGDVDLGLLGELDPRVVKALDLRTDHPVLAAELDLEALVTVAVPHFQVEPVPQFPAVREDLALVVDAHTPAAEVERALLAAGAPLLRSARLFDVYTKDMDGRKSLAYHLTFQAPNRTLQDKDVEKLRRRILGRVEQDVGAVLR